MADPWENYPYVSEGTSNRDLHQQQPRFDMADALAKSLREIMRISGKPMRNDRGSPGYFYNPKLYEEHLRQWDEAKRMLELYDERKS